MLIFGLIKHEDDDFDASTISDETIAELKAKLNKLAMKLESDFSKMTGSCLNTDATYHFEVEDQLPIDPYYAEELK